MMIAINTDNHIEGKERMNAYFESVINDSLKRYEDRISRLDVKLSDENSGAKKSEDDKRCTITAHVTGLKDVAVTNHADTVEKAITGAVSKLKNALEHAIGKVQSH
jgi:ribosomal subunit interface protein